MSCRVSVVFFRCEQGRFSTLVMGPFLFGSRTSIVPQSGQRWMCGCVSVSVSVRSLCFLIGAGPGHSPRLFYAVSSTLSPLDALVAIVCGVPNIFGDSFYCTWVLHPRY